MADLLSELFKLDNQVVVVTGAGGYLGGYHAEAIAAFGGTPILIDIEETRTAARSELLRSQYNVPAMSIAVDITNEAEVAAAVDQVLEKHGRIDALINNAANNPEVTQGLPQSENFTRLENFPIEAWEADLRVGLTGSFLCAKHFGAKLALNHSGGVIINVSSDLGLIAPDQRLYTRPGLAEHQPVKPVSYSVAKTGLLGLTRYLATYWNEGHVRCNAICLGGVRKGQNQEFLERVAERIPLGRLANPDEYQGTIVWLLSRGSSYLNGAVIAIDGGRSVW
jgi:NAD(P)-dependent dehydrogenase (short-subunit alcohol dehydrogenase family)